MDLLKFRCPSCRKLFSADGKDIAGTRPKFQCPQCQSKFWVDVPETISAQVEAHSHLVATPPEKPTSQVNLGQEDSGRPNSSPASEVFAERSAVSSDTSAGTQTTGTQTTGTATSHLDLDTVGKKLAGVLKTCPRCKAEVEVEAKECAKCGVIFERLRNREFRPDPVAVSSAPTPELGDASLIPQALREQWTAVLNQWDNKVLHDQFFQAAVAQNQLPYASRVYKKYLEAHPGDPTAQLLRDRIINVSVFTLMPERRSPEKRRRFGFTGIVIILGALLLITGIVVPSMKTLTAVGAATLALGLGMKFYLKF